ncbi:site-specific integrase [Caldibacillus debilis]|uniref:site-specific integrase n=1 Tax=Caldibacillus debilis TaxID=301148 RepID=UPI002FD9F41F
MEYVDPIKDVEKINQIKKILRESSLRDLLLFTFGINTGIPISDLLSLSVGDVWDGEKAREFLYLKDKKNGTPKAVYLNDRVREVLEEYLNKCRLKPADYLFKSRKNDRPITRQQAYRIINHAARKAGISGRIGTHTLRKTFGYHAYRKGVAISILMALFNHHSPSETLRYIGIDKNDKKPVKLDVNL